MDLRKINAVLEERICSPPPISEIIRKISAQRACYFSTIDFRAAFNQMPLARDSMKFMSASSHYGQVLSSRCVFGCSSSPSYYQELMIGVLSSDPDLEKATCCHLDDIIVSTETIEEHYRVL